MLPGLLVIPFVGWVGDHHGFRVGMLAMTPVFLVGGLLIASVRSVIEEDIAQVWTGAATRPRCSRTGPRGSCRSCGSTTYGSATATSRSCSVWI